MKLWVVGRCILRLWIFVPNSSGSKHVIFYINIFDRAKFSRSVEYINWCNSNFSLISLLIIQNPQRIFSSKVYVQPSRNWKIGSRSWDQELSQIPVPKYLKIQKCSRLRCLLRVKGLVKCFYLGWSGSTLQFRQNIIKVGSKSLTAVI